LIAEMLPPQDALTFSRCCRLSRIVCVHNVPIAAPDGRWSCGVDDYAAKRWQPVTLRTPAIHTVITFDWKDQGWGYQKGWFMLMRGDARAPGGGEDWTPDTIAYAGTAPHEMEHTEVVAKVPEAAGEPTVECTMWVLVGGGGGHSLTISGLAVRQLLYLSCSEAPHGDCLLPLFTFLWTRIHPSSFPMKLHDVYTRPPARFDPVHNAH